MPQKQQNLQDIFRERRMKDMKRDYYTYKIQQFWTLIKRVALIASLGYGGVWASKSENQHTLKSFLKSHSVPIEQRVDSFKEGMSMIKDIARENNSKQAQAYHDQREKQINEYRKIGIDPVIRYAESGTKDYRDELEFYRKSGVFSARDD